MEADSSSSAAADSTKTPSRVFSRCLWAVFLTLAVTALLSQGSVISLYIAGASFGLLMLAAVGRLFWQFFYLEQRALQDYLAMTFCFGLTLGSLTAYWDSYFWIFFIMALITSLAAAQGLGKTLKTIPKNVAWLRLILFIWAVSSPALILMGYSCGVEAFTQLQRPFAAERWWWITQHATVPVVLLLVGCALNVITNYHGNKWFRRAVCSVMGWDFENSTIASSVPRQS